MHGIVSLLDRPHYDRVERLWVEIERRFGIKGIFVTPYPHFSYHVMAAYDADRLIPNLNDLARKTAVFQVQATGIGIFTGPSPVVYVPVARNPILTALHARLWPLVDAISEDSMAYYQPQQWFPHITLANDDLQPEQLGALVTWLNQQNTVWDITIDNFALLHDPQAQHSLHHQVQFAG